jgi:hypothetical protein
MAHSARVTRTWPSANGKPRLLDNLIPLRGDTFGPQLAGWIPGRRSAAGSADMCVGGDAGACGEPLRHLIQQVSRAAPAATFDDL